MRGVLAALGVFLLLGLPSRASAQTAAEPIGYGETVSNTLDAETYRRLYRFAGRRDEIISLRLQAITGDLDPFLALLDAGGAGLAFSDDEGSGQNALLDSVRLPADGDYFILVTRFGHGLGSTSGTYELTLQRLGATTTAGATIRYGDSIIGEIREAAPQVVYVFSGQRGEVVNLRMQRTSGNLDPFLDLANAAGQILRSGDDDPTAAGTLNAGILNFTLPESGFYIVVATRYGRESGTTTGSYLLNLAAIPREELGLAPSNALLLDYGETATGRLDAEAPQRFYFFEGKRGDVVNLDLQRTAGNLNTALLLLDSNLRELATITPDPPTNRALISAFTLPQDGVYYILAGRAGFSGGDTAGEFALTFVGRAGIAGSQYLEILYGSEQRGFISDALPFETYVFQGQAGDVITARLDATSGDLDPLLTLYLENKQIAFDDDSGENKNAAIIDFALPQAGIYRLEVARFDRGSGNTTGEYLLSLAVR